MYENLIRALKAKGISNNAAAAAIGMPETTFRSKITTERSFYVEEALSIKANLFPEMEVGYLFERTDPPAADEQ